MSGNGWKVVQNDAGITISNDLFRLTSNSPDPAQLENVVFELQDAVHPTYGQYCGLAKAAEMIGERWGLLIVRDLLVGPKTAARLSTGLPGIPAGLLSTRLRAMEVSGIVRAQDGPDGTTYELTDYGRSVEDALLALSRWGAGAMDTPRPGDVITQDSLTMALRSTFQPAAAAGLTASFQVNAGDVILHALVEAGELTVRPGSLRGADLVIDTGPVLKHVMSGAVSAQDAIASGQMTAYGDADLLPTFTRVFHLDAAVPA